MDKNNRKLKILYNCIMANASATWQQMLHIPPTKIKNTQLLTAKNNNTQNKSHTKEPTFRKLEV